MANVVNVQGKDIAIENLVPLRVRDINLKSHAGFARIVATIKAVGLVEPVCVYKKNGKYSILDGYLRFKAFEKLGVRKVPCRVFSNKKNKETYTWNKKVSRISAVQENRMLQKALKTVAEPAISGTFGLRSIKYRLAATVIKQLHLKVIKVLDDNFMSRKCAAEFTYVKPKRQLQILREMQKNNDYSRSFARALVIKTPESLRNGEKKKRKPWTQDPTKGKELVAKLEEAQKSHDFYTTTYHRYSTDLLKTCSYVGKLITSKKVKKYLKDKFPDVLACFEKIVLETDGRKID
ncbi:MAG: hypothetical protein E3J72_12255 [Planctomycetota bacterium]|nr:MAG: hypothetical protein E3J72_12255 [Planctomycetota bacterium]